MAKNSIELMQLIRKSYADAESYEDSRDRHQIVYLNAFTTGYFEGFKDAKSDCLWIDADERIPVFGVLVLAVYEHMLKGKKKSSVALASLSADGWYYNGMRDDDKVTMWMYIPKFDEE